MKKVKKKKRKRKKQVAATVCPFGVFIVRVILMITTTTVSVQ